MMLSKTRFKVNSNKFINKNVQVVLHGLFFSHADDKNGKMLNIRRTLKAKPFTFKVKRQRLKILLMDQRWCQNLEVNAKALAQKIYDVLNSDSKMSDLIKARYAQIQVNYKRVISGLSTLMFTKKKEKVHHQALKNHQNLRLHQVMILKQKTPKSSRTQAP